MEGYGNPQMLGHLPETGDDLVDDKQIRAFCPAPGIVEHQSPFSDASRDIWDSVQVEQWRFVRVLGHGGFGQVHLEEKVFERFPQFQTSRPQFRAVKVLPESSGALRTMQHLPEILGMAKFSRFGASFIQLFAWFQVDAGICIAMEWAPYGDLEACVLESLPEVDVQEIVRQITLAMVIMHERHFLHRDLKPRNVFVFRKRPESPEWRVKLGDFGVSKRVRDASTSWHTSIDADCSAPEVLGLLGGDYTEESSYANPVDMWSLGYLVHWLLARRYPLSRFDLPRYCWQKDPIPLAGLSNARASTQAVDFVKNLLRLDPADRMTAQEAYRHPWLVSSDRRSVSSLEGSSLSYRPQQVRRSTSAMSTGISSGDRTSQSAEGQTTPTGDQINQEFRNTASGDYHHFPQKEGSLLNDQILRPLADTSHRHTEENHSEVGKPHRAGQTLRPAIEDEYNEEETSSLEPVSAPRGDKGEIEQPRAQAGNNINRNSPDGEEIDFDAIEAEFAAAEAEEVRREEEYMKKAAEKEVLRRLEEKERAIYEASFKGMERQVEEEETRREEQRKQKDDSTAGTNKQLFEKQNSDNHDEAKDVKSTNFEGIAAQADIKSLAAGAKSDAPAGISLREPGKIESKALESLRNFASVEREKLLETRRAKALQDRTAKLNDLVKFSKTFKLNSPPPTDLIPILAKDAVKQAAIVDSYKKQSQETVELPQRPKPLQQSVTAQSVTATQPSKSIARSQQTSDDAQSRPTWAKVASSGVPVAQSVNQAPTDTKLSKNQKRRQKRRAANGTQ